MISELKMIRDFNATGNWQEQLGTAIFIGCAMLALDTATTPGSLDVGRMVAFAMGCGVGVTLFLTGRSLRKKGADIINTILDEARVTTTLVERED